MTNREETGTGLHRKVQRGADLAFYALHRDWQFLNGTIWVTAYPSPSVDYSGQLKKLPRLVYYTRLGTAVDMFDIDLGCPEPYCSSREAGVLEDRWP